MCTRDTRTTPISVYAPKAFGSAVATASHGPGGGVDEVNEAQLFSHAHISVIAVALAHASDRLRNVFVFACGRLGV